MGVRARNHDGVGCEDSETHVMCWWEIVDDVMNVEYCWRWILDALESLCFGIVGICIFFTKTAPTCGP